MANDYDPVYGWDDKPFDQKDATELEYLRTEDDLCEESLLYCMCILLYIAISREHPLKPGVREWFDAPAAS